MIKRLMDAARQLHKSTGTVPPPSALEDMMLDLTRRALHLARGKVERWVSTTCGYCSTGCGLLLGLEGDTPVAIRGDEACATNRGQLCIKGAYQWRTLRHPERATTPMVRKNGQLVPVSWEEALQVVADKIREAIAEQGPEGVGIYGSGQLTLEENYALTKLARGVLKTPNFDSNTRLCMSGTVQGLIKVFGADGPPGCYEDLDLADCLLIFGCNPAEMHPQLWRRMLKNKLERGARLIVVDPRRTIPARVADLHLQLRPGTNIYLLNAILHVLFRDNLINREEVARLAVGLERVEEIVKKYSPAEVAPLCGVAAVDIEQVARWIAEARAATTVFVQGVTQSAAGVEAVSTICTLHLLTGHIGRPGAAPFSLTGQAAAMSAREVGASGFLPGYRNWQNPRHRQEVAVYWGIKPEELPAGTNDIGTMLDMIAEGKLKVLWNIATNPVVSLPEQARVRPLLEKVFLIVQDIFYPVETAQYADVFLPAAQWGEKTGTYTNSERRVNLAERAVNPPGMAKTDLEIIQLVAKRLGAEEAFAWPDPEAVFEEWKGLSRGRPCDMSGITYGLIRQERGVQWPYPAGGVSQQRLYTDGHFWTDSEQSQSYGDFNQAAGKAWLFATDIPGEILRPTEEYPFYLNTGRIMEHYHSRTKTKRIPEIQQLAPEPFLEINPLNAQTLGIKEGEKVRIVSPWGTAVARARLCDTVAPGQVFLPFHFGDADYQQPTAGNNLIGNVVNPLSRQPLFKLGICRLEKCPD